jgi:transposase
VLSIGDGYTRLFWSVLVLSDWDHGVAEYILSTLSISLKIKKLKSSVNTMSQWVSLYREQGEAGLAVQPQGRPQGSGQALSNEQAQEMCRLVVDSLPCDHDIASATWTRQAAAELIAKRMGIELTWQGVGKYLRRWGLTPQKPARQTREQDPKEVQTFVEETLPKVTQQAQEEEAQCMLSMK